MLDIFKNLFDRCLIEHLKIAEFYINNPIYRTSHSKDLFDCCLIDGEKYE